MMCSSPAATLFQCTIAVYRVQAKIRLLGTHGFMLGRVFVIKTPRSCGTVPACGALPLLRPALAEGIRG